AVDQEEAVDQEAAGAHVEEAEEAGAHEEAEAAADQEEAGAHVEEAGAHVEAEEARANVV
ncbi:hypothetical protein, partial [Neobacillus novalis]